jgi:hypothetical protein
VSRSAKIAGRVLCRLALSLTVWLAALACLRAEAGLANAEYFIGTDPGPGNATSLLASDGLLDSLAESVAEQSISAASLAAGVHRIGLRFRDTEGNWGNVVYLDVRVENAAGLTPDPPLLTGGQTALRTSSGAEYALDGGSGVALSAEDGAFDSVTETTMAEALPVSSLSVGVHRVALRFQDTDGRWGNDAFVDVRVEDAAALAVTPPLLADGQSALRVIAGAEYALDGGSAVALAAQDGGYDSVAESTVERAIASASLSVGVHRVALRTPTWTCGWRMQAAWRLILRC